MPIASTSLGGANSPANGDFSPFLPSFDDPCDLFRSVEIILGGGVWPIDITFGIVGKLIKKRK